MSRRVVVVGAGVAGLAAAWSARQAGREVTLAGMGAGASALGSGAADDVPWDLWARAAKAIGAPKDHEARPLPAETAAFVEALGLWAVPESHRPWLATVAGRIRPARGRDRALLDLSALSGALVLLPRAPRATWDADALAAAFARDPFARARRLTFRAVDLPVLRFDDEHRIGDADLAARHDDEGRLAWLAGRLREGLGAAGGAGAILLGPWLGASAPRADALSAAVGVPCGEALSGAGSPAGLRFEAARDRMLETLGVRVVRDRVTRVISGEPVSVSLARDGAPLTADAVVLAIGGVVAGGVLYTPPDAAGSAGGRVPFALSVDAEVTLSAGGPARMDIVASTHGPELDAWAWPAGDRPGALEAVGVRCEEGLAAPGVFAAGDVVAGRPRTVLEAAASGVLAGARAAA